MKRVVLMLLALAAAVGLARALKAEIPAMKRYIKIERM
jgi:hypothetical protein